MTAKESMVSASAADKKGRMGESEGETGEGKPFRFLREAAREGNARVLDRAEGQAKAARGGARPEGKPPPGLLG